MIAQALCDGCGRWLHPGLIELCVDCARNLCPLCVESTEHRNVHEDAAEYEREAMPLGWYYLRCADTPYSIHAHDDTPAPP